MSKIVNRIGEENYNSFGSKMIITRYNGAKDLDIYIFLNIIGYLNMHNMVILKKELLNVLMNLDIIVKVI